MAKTYYPSAVIVADRAHKYLSRYQASLSLTISPGQASALTALILCLAQFLAAWPKEPIQP
jgi:hypothetical protein